MDAAAGPVDSALCLHLLRRWLEAAEAWWYPLRGPGELGCYGSGYNSWGVQTNQKYLAAAATVATLGASADDLPAESLDLARRRAFAALRFSFASHVTGDGACTDGGQWGRTWISALGIERMMHGVQLLEPQFKPADQAALKRLLTCEADHLLSNVTRGRHSGVVAGRWAADGRNVPESNLWNGALLWRTAARYPDHPRADDWREMAHRLLLNSISVEADASDPTVVAGKPIRDRFVGANFFDHYALDHHGYFNVGYQVICLSNAAMLHYDLKALRHGAPETLYHHNVDLWEVVRGFVFADGRLARLGGDSRVRYTYCQEYLLPTLVYAADVLGDREADAPLAGQVELIRAEAAHHGDGSFYGERLRWLAEQSPYYYTRLESDRACALSQALVYSQLRERPPSRAVTADSFERSAARLWCEPEHGAVMHRSPTRLASFAWRAYGLTQGFCLPPDDGHLADWTQNLAGSIRFLGDDGGVDQGQVGKRRLLRQEIRPFDGGFVTWGAVMEGCNVVLAEGWSGAESAVHQLAFVALPDAHTVVGLQHCRTLDHRTYLAEVKGMRLNLPNDLYNGFHRRLETPRGDVLLLAPATAEQVIQLGGRWAVIAARLGVVGLYGAPELAVHRSARRRGGKYRSLYVDEICFGCELGTRAISPSSVILDVGWMVRSSADLAAVEAATQQTQILAHANDSALRVVEVPGQDGTRYLLAANFAAAPQVIDLARWQAGRTVAELGTDNGAELAAGEARVWRLG